MPTDGPTDAPTFFTEEELRAFIAHRDPCDFLVIFATEVLALRKQLSEAHMLAAELLAATRERDEHLAMRNKLAREAADLHDRSITAEREAKAREEEARKQISDHSAEWGFLSVENDILKHDLLAARKVIADGKREVTHPDEPNIIDELWAEEGGIAVRVRWGGADRIKLEIVEYVQAAKVKVLASATIAYFRRARLAKVIDSERRGCD